MYDKYVVFGVYILGCHTIGSVVTFGREHGKSPLPNTDYVYVVYGLCIFEAYLLT